MRESAKYLRVLELCCRPNNPLFVSETGNDKAFVRFMFATLGPHGIGFVPFGVDFTGYANYPLGAKPADPQMIEPFATYRLLEPMARKWAIA